MTDSAPCIFGEVLFDHFPDGARVLGGAPFNVAWHLQAFGCAPHFISRVGNDAEGSQVREAMHEWGMDCSGLQTDHQHPTGRVEVTFDNGEPAYDIVHPAAYDAIALATQAPCRLLYHGSLAVRASDSREALDQLLAAGPRTVFLDVNLRPPWWHADTLHELLHSADWVKLNGDELHLLSTDAADEADRATAFVRRYGLRGLVLTHGARGAQVVTATAAGPVVTPAAGGEVVDTVGAGDAFASVVILGLLHDWPLPLTLQRAQQFASRIVRQRGATVSDPTFYAPFVQEWNLPR